MFIRVKVRGPTENDPGRTVELPTWNMQGDIDNDGFVVVQVPDDDMPTDHDRWNQVRAERIGNLHVVTHMPDGVLNNWLRRLSERYDAMESTFRPFG